MNLQSSTLLSEDTGVPFGELQAEQIDAFRDAWIAAGWEREPRVSVSRSVLPIVTDEDRLYFGGRNADGSDQLGRLEGTIARFGRSYTGEPDVIAEELGKDPAVQMADTVLLDGPQPARGRVLRDDARDDRASHRAGLRLVAGGKSRARCRFIQ